MEPKQASEQLSRPGADGLAFWLCSDSWAIVCWHDTPKVPNGSTGLLHSLVHIPSRTEGKY